MADEMKDEYDIRGGERGKYCKREPGEKVWGSLGSGPFAGKLIVFASTLNIERLQPYVDRVLEAVGHPEALVTDKSMIADFPIEDDELPELSEKLGVEVKQDSYIWKLAEDLSNLNEHLFGS